MRRIPYKSNGRGIVSDKIYYVNLILVGQNATGHLSTAIDLSEFFRALKTERLETATTPTTPVLRFSWCIDRWFNAPGKEAFQPLRPIFGAAHTASGPACLCHLSIVQRYPRIGLQMDQFNDGIDGIGHCR